MMMNLFNIDSSTVVFYRGIPRHATSVGDLSRELSGAMIICLERKCRQCTSIHVMFTEQFRSLVVDQSVMAAGLRSSRRLCPEHQCRAGILRHGRRNRSGVRTGTDH